MKNYLKNKPGEIRNRRKSLALELQQRATEMALLGAQPLTQKENQRVSTASFTNAVRKAQRGGCNTTSGNVNMQVCVQLLQL